MKPLRILIADDDGVTLIVLRKVVTTLGHEVVAEAGDGEQALALAREHQPDLVILDIRMPNLDGLQAARQIQADRPTPVIILSAHSESGLGSEAANVGAHAYLVKPFTADQLKPAIELALANFARTREQDEKIRKMNEALETRKVVERAKGILMRQTDLDEESAYLRLQKTARNENRKLREVAQAIILADEMQRDDSGKPPPRRRS